MKSCSIQVTWKSYFNYEGSQNAEIRFEFWCIFIFGQIIHISGLSVAISETCQPPNSNTTSKLNPFCYVKTFYYVFQLIKNSQKISLLVEIFVRLDA